MKFITSLLSFWMVLAAPALAEPELTTQRYRIKPTLFEAVRSLENKEYPVFWQEASTITEVTEAEWKKYLSEVGMAFPEGASIRYDLELGQMIVRSTPEDLELFERLYFNSGLTEMMIEVEMLCVHFEQELIASLLRQGKLDGKALLALWQEGKGELICAPRVTTVSGQPGAVQYPSSAVNPNHLKTKSTATNTNPQAVNTPFLNVMPTYNATGSINISITSDIFTGSAVLVDGQPILIGGGYTTTENGKLLYVFVTARLIDPKTMKVHGKKVQK